METKEEKRIIICPQCKTKVRYPCNWCWFCDMAFSKMEIMFKCNKCGMQFRDKFSIEGNECHRSNCGSKNIKVIYRQEWTYSDIEYLMAHLDYTPVILAKYLKRPVEAVSRKKYRIKKNILKEILYG